MYHSEITGADIAAPDHDQHIAAWLAAHTGTEFGGTPVQIALLNDDGEVYRLITAEGIIDLIGLAAMLMRLGLVSGGRSGGYDDTFRMPATSSAEITPSIPRTPPPAKRLRPVRRQG